MRLGVEFLLYGRARWSVVVGLGRSFGFSFKQGAQVRGGCHGTPHILFS